jgi:hypothetical protein
MAAVLFIFAHFNHQHKYKAGNKKTDAEKKKRIVPDVVVGLCIIISLCKSRLRKQDQDNEPTARCF